MNDSLDISTDIENLRQIKDIRDELNIMLSVFHQQNKVVQAMTRTLREINIEQSSPAKWPMTTNPIDSMSYTLEDGNARKAYNLTLPAVVGRSIDEVKRLDHFAERTAKAVSNQHYCSFVPNWVYTLSDVKVLNLGSLFRLSNC